MANNSTASIGNIRKKFHEIHELISTSYHEAGHTVYGLLSLMKIESVCVFADKKSKRIEGFTHYNSPRLDFIQDNTLFGNRLYCEIGLSYAGLIAEKRHFKLISGSDKFPSVSKRGIFIRYRVCGCNFFRNIIFQNLVKKGINSKRK